MDGAGRRMHEERLAQLPVSHPSCPAHLHACTKPLTTPCTPSLALDRVCHCPGAALVDAFAGSVAFRETKHPFETQGSKRPRAMPSVLCRRRCSTMDASGGWHAEDRPCRSVLVYSWTTVCLFTCVCVNAVPATLPCLVVCSRCVAASRGWLSRGITC